MVIAIMAMFLPSLFVLGRLSSFTLERAGVALSHPWYQLDPEEGALLFQATNLAQGQLPYRVLDGPPYVVGTYPPVYLGLSAVVAAVAADNETTFFAGRAVTVGAAICIAALMTVLVSLRTRQPLAGLLAAALFLATYEVYRWVGYYRVDLAAIAFTLLGLACVLSTGRGDRVGLVLAAAMCALALLTKQTMIAAPTAIFLWLAGSGQFRAALGFGFTTGVFLLVPIAVLSIATQGQYLVHTVVYNANAWTAADFAVWARHGGVFYKFLLAAGAGALLWTLAAGGAGLFAARRHPVAAKTTESEPDTDADDDNPAVIPDTPPSAEATTAPRPARLLPIYAVLTLWNVVAAGKAGSAENYWLEPLAALALLVGDTAGRMMSAVLTAQRGTAVLASGAAGVVLAGLVGAHTLWLASDWRPMAAFARDRSPSVADFADAARVASLVRKAPEPTFSQWPIFDLLAGRPMIFQPFIASELMRQGRLKTDDFHADLRAGKFSLLVLSVDLATTSATAEFTTDTLSAMRDGYREDQRLTNGRYWRYILYRPRRDPAPPPAGPPPDPMNFVQQRTAPHNYAERARRVAAA